MPGLAKALECDPAMPFKLALEPIGGDTTVTAIEQIFGTVVTRKEVAWIEFIRLCSRDADPAPTLQRVTTPISFNYGPQPRKTGPSQIRRSKD